MVDKDKIAELYASGLSMAKVAAATGNSVGTIHKILNQMGIQRQHGGKPKPNVDTMKQLYLSGMSLKEVGKKFGYNSENTVAKIFRKNGIPVRTRAGKGDTVNHSYFSKIDTENKAYILGLLLADGNITERDKSQNAVRIELQKTDISTLQLIKREFQTQNRITQSRGCYRISVHSNQMCDNLKEYSVFPRKTNKKFFPINKIAPEFQSHFLRGFFDGNGWVTRTYHTLRGIKYPSVGIGFSDGYELLEELESFLETRLHVNHVKVCRSKGCYMILHSAKKDVIAIRDYMYKDATEYMQRKYDKFFGNTERG